MILKINFDYSEIISSNYFKYTLVVIITIVVALVLSKILRGILNGFINKSTETMKVDATRFKFLKNAVSFIIFLGAVMTIFYAIPELRALGLTLFAGAGIFAAIIGFASQQTFSNIVSGIFIVFSKPFSVGDMVTIGTHNGIVEDITLRHTVIRNFENRRVVIPNAVMSTETILNSNLTEAKVRNFIEIGISYDSDIDLAMKIMQDEAIKHPEFIDNRTKEEISKNVSPVAVRVIDFGDSSVNLRAYVWAKDPVAGFYMKCDLNKAIKQQFDKQGVEIPFPYRTIVYKKDLDENAKLNPDD